MHESTILWLVISTSSNSYFFRIWRPYALKQRYMFWSFSHRLSQKVLDVASNALIFQTFWEAWLGNRLHKYDWKCIVADIIRELKELLSPHCYIKESQDRTILNIILISSSFSGVRCCPYNLFFILSSRLSHYSFIWSHIHPCLYNKTITLDNVLCSSPFLSLWQIFPTFQWHWKRRKASMKIIAAKKSRRTCHKANVSDEFRPQESKNFLYPLSFFSFLSSKVENINRWFMLILKISLD